MGALIRKRVHGGDKGLIFLIFIYGPLENYIVKTKIKTVRIIKIKRLSIQWPFHSRRRTSRPTIRASNVNSRVTIHLVLVIVNSYRDGQTDDFEARGLALTGLVTLLLEKKNGCQHQVHMEWAFIKRK